MNVRVFMSIPHMAGHKPKGLILVKYNTPVTRQPKIMLVVAALALVFFQKKAPKVAGTNWSRYAELVTESSTIKPKGLSEKRTSKTMIIPITIFPNLRDSSSEALGLRFLYMSMVAIELRVKSIESEVETAAAKILTITMRANGAGTSPNSVGMARSGLDRFGIKSLEAKPRSVTIMV